MTAVITVNDVSKRYLIRHNTAEPYVALRDVLAARIRHALTSIGRTSSQDPERGATREEFWALRGVSCEIEQGDRVAIIGRNGAGKSTLLKVLSRITAPTAGRIRITGQVASLLEVGTGFHPELTGRENIFLNGAILGMTKREIHKKFDEIVDFAEVEKFLDTPLKRYSTGMFVRLAFSVASHLEPDILMVDEVLSVGDVQFQKKCLGRMGEVSKEGRTIIFVSHNLEAIRALCDRAILLDGGVVVADDSVNNALEQYLGYVNRSSELGGKALANRLDRCTGSALFHKVTALDSVGRETWRFKSGDDVRLRFEYRVEEPLSCLSIFLGLRSMMGDETITTVKCDFRESSLDVGDCGAVNIVLPNIPLRPGEYSLYVCLGDRDGERIHDVVDRNVDLPLLMVDSDEQDPFSRGGRFSIDYEVSTEDLSGAGIAD